MDLKLWKWTRPFLVFLNIILLVAALVMTFRAYGRVPQSMKAPFFFLWPIVQAVLNLAAVILGRRAASRSRVAPIGPLREEHIYMGMIFLNVILIHLERNVISLTLLGQSSLYPTYLITLAVILGLIYFLYRLRLQALSRR